MLKTRTAVLVACVFAFAAAHAEESGRSSFSEQLARQQTIYETRGDEEAKGYTVDRPLASYSDALASGFGRSLGELGPGDRWLDIGAGEARAILDYYTPGFDKAYPEGKERRGTKARAIAISIEDRRTPLWQKTADGLGTDQIRYLSGKRFGEYSSEELGRFQLITDVLGGFSYTDDLSRFVTKVLQLLDVNGSFFTVLQDVEREDGGKPYYEGSPFLTVLKNGDGSDMKICSWLKQISCVEVTCEARAHWRPPVEAYRVRKVCSDVSVPSLLPVHYEAGTPPERRFAVKQAESRTTASTR